MSNSVKRLACVVIVAAISAPPIGGQTRTAAPSNLWIGVVHQDRYLEPIGARVNGTWWYDDDNEPGRHFEMTERAGRVPAEWFPLGTRLPLEWRVHVLDGRTMNVHTSGPLQESTNIPDRFRVRTDMPSMPAVDADPDKYTSDETEPLGVAVSAAVDVRPFLSRWDRKRNEVPRFLGPAMSAAERAAIKKKGSSLDEDAPYFAAITDQMIRAAQFELDHVYATTQPDRSVLYFVEGGKTYGETSDCGTRFRATVTESRAGTLKLLDLKVDPYCDLYVLHRPIAILERGGVSCWLTQRLFEDGVQYALTGSKHLSFDEEPSNCDLK